MRFVFLAIAFAVTVALLTTVHAAVPTPSYGQRDSDFRPIVADGCGYGWHWVAGHATLDGSWAAGRCQIDG
ncbi:MAG TPA: hypothetical protein VGR70_15930 [Stellaceae bacterium]|nr:hypothetical protein [Stellaceae bacterium]